MVRNIGGYSRAYGAAAETNDLPPQPMPPHEPPPEPPVENTASRHEDAGFRASVGALVSMVLDGQSIPLPVSRFLLADSPRKEAVREAREIVRKSRRRRQDMKYVDNVLGTVREQVIENVVNAPGHGRKQKPTHTTKTELDQEGMISRQQLDRAEIADEDRTAVDAIVTFIKNGEPEVDTSVVSRAVARNLLSEVVANGDFLLGDNEETRRFGAVNKRVQAIRTQQAAAAEQPTRASTQHYHRA